MTNDDSNKPQRRKGIQPSTPGRIEWEVEVLRAIVASGISRSDAQAIVEGDKASQLLDALFADGTAPGEAAQRFR